MFRDLEGDGGADSERHIEKEVTVVYLRGSLSSS